MIILKAKFENLDKLKTKTNLVFSTKEEIPKLEELQLIQAEGFLVFNVDEYRTKVLNIIKNKRIGIDESELPFSQRLRAVLYRIWEQSGTGEFEDFYSQQMERIIDHFKTKYL